MSYDLELLRFFGGVFSGSYTFYRGRFSCSHEERNLVQNASSPCWRKKLLAPLQLSGRAHGNLFKKKLSTATALSQQFPSLFMLCSTDPPPVTLSTSAWWWSSARLSVSPWSHVGGRRSYPVPVAQWLIWGCHSSSCSIIKPSVKFRNPTYQFPLAEQQQLEEGVRKVKII